MLSILLVLELATSLEWSVCVLYVWLVDVPDSCTGGVVTVVGVYGNIGVA